MVLNFGKDETVYAKYGFLPTSCWWFAKTASLQAYVDDEVAEGTYARESDVANNRLSQFNPVIAEKIIRIWSEPHDKILDPFAGRARGLMAQLHNRQYVGYEISPKVCKQLQERLARQGLGKGYQHAPQVLNKDSRTIDYGEMFDLVFSCPPYWNVEDYNEAYGESNPGQLSDFKKYEDFLVDYEAIIGKCFKALKKGKYAVWVVSDIRRDKKLIPFAADTIRIFQKQGFTPHDIVINKLNSLAVLGIGSALENKYTPKVHEYILVFKKW